MNMREERERGENIGICYNYMNDKCLLSFPWGHRNKYVLYFTNTEYFKRAQDALKNITFSKFIVKFLTNSIFECYVKINSILFRRIRHALNLIYQYDVCIVV